MKRALVTGGSGGIGAAICRRLAADGHHVIVHANRGLDKAQALVAEIAAAGGRAEAIAFDVTDRAATAAALEAITEAGTVQILVNNTGGPPGGTAHAAGIDAYLDAFNKHLVANHTLMQAALPGMCDAGWGRIVNVISTSVYEPIPNLGVSNTVRGAVASWAKTLSRELGGDGITVNNVLPGYTRTQRLDQILADRSAATGKPQDEIAKGMRASVPVGRFADAGEIGGVIAFLCTQAAAYVNGQSLAVDGGRMQSI